MIRQYDPSRDTVDVSLLKEKHFRNKKDADVYKAIARNALGLVRQIQSKEMHTSNEFYAIHRVVEEDDSMSEERKTYTVWFLDEKNERVGHGYALDLDTANQIAMDRIRTHSDIVKAEVHSNDTKVVVNTFTKHNLNAFDERPKHIALSINAVVIDDHSGEAIKDLGKLNYNLNIPAETYQSIANALKLPTQHREFLQTLLSLSLQL